MRWTLDESWSTGAGPRPLQLGLATFGILALELALIRWTAGQIRFFAYFNNLVLISAFFGMGLGVALGRRRPGLVHAALPMLVLVGLPLALAADLGLIRLAFPDEGVFLWGAESVSGGGGEAVLSVLLLLVLFCGIAAVFLFAGAAVGHLFAGLPALRAYSADLTGSLCGVVAFTGMTFFDVGPPWWLAFGALPFAWLSRRTVAWVALVVIVGLGWVSVRGAIFSPYNRIDYLLRDNHSVVHVNRDFHQYLHDLSDQALADPRLDEMQRRDLELFRAAYDLPFEINPARERVLVVGAGTGNDVQAALRNGYRRVVAVDIDPQLVGFGRRHHPEHPYDDPRVKVEINDARAFFEQYTGPAFDLVCYGLLDSHAMFSSMSSLRLDNFVYTEEGIRAAWRHVSDRGHLAISYSLMAGDWIGERLFWTITRATGKQPWTVFHGMHRGALFVVPRDENQVDRARLTRFAVWRPQAARTSVWTTSDDWPFLYLRQDRVPWMYLCVLVAILVMALVATPLAFGRAALTTAFDPVLFFMGAAFLLLETRGVTSLSLLFGSTWLVNSAIFAGVLIMVLLANLLVLRLGLRNPRPYYLPLVLSVVSLALFEPGWLNQYGLLGRGLLGGLFHALPIGLAGIIVSIWLANSANPAAALGSNLLGSVLGGCLEYSSMFLGLRALVVLALGLYLVAIGFAWRRGVPAADRKGG